MSFLMNTCVHIGFWFSVWVYLGVLKGVLVLSWVFCGYSNLAYFGLSFYFAYLLTEAKHLISGSVKLCRCAPLSS